MQFLMQFWHIQIIFEEHTSTSLNPKGLEEYYKFVHIIPVNGK